MNNDLALCHLLTNVGYVSVLFGCLTFFVLLHQIPRNRQLNSWMATNLYSLFRTMIVLMVIPVASAFAPITLPPILQIAAVALLAYLSPVLFLVLALMQDGVPAVKRKLDIAAVVKELEAKYPGKTIILSPEKNPTEVICEIERTNEYSKIVAVTKQSEQHYHSTITETYKVLSGRLKVHTTSNGRTFPPEVLAPGLSTVVLPNTIHWVEGVDENEDTWIEAECRPPWTPEDHHVVK